MTDGTAEYNATNYRVSFFYDLAKVAVNRLAWSQGHELEPHGATGFINDDGVDAQNALTLVGMFCVLLFITQLGDAGFKIWIIGNQALYAKAAFTLYDNGGAAIGHLYQLYNFGYCTYAFQVGKYRIFYIAVFLCQHANQFGAFIGIGYRFNAFIATHRNGNYNARK